MNLKLWHVVAQQEALARVHGTLGTEPPAAPMQLRVSGLGFRVSGLGAYRVEGVGFRASVLKGLGFKRFRKSWFYPKLLQSSRTEGL